MRTGRILASGLVGGFLGNSVLGALFSAPLVTRVLFNPSIQSPVFIDLAHRRNIPVSVAGLVLLSVIHAWLFETLRPSIPGSSWMRQGLFFGATIWLMYWVPQEWFIYHTLLGEPLTLNALELVLLLIGSGVEGVFLAYALSSRTSSVRAAAGSAHSASRAARG